jgi:hypothetical protein
VVTIYGTGFSPTPSQNVVKFNGTTAVVTSSTTTQISTTVPVGATTGLISVTTASVTVSSATAFTVGSDAPIITSFTPAIGTAGTTVTLSGSNFESATYANRVEFNGTPTIVTAASPTSITTSVPTGATSGRISNTTPVGKGVSNTYFFIPPDPFTAADVEVFTTMAIGETKLVTIATANKVAIVLFDGVAGQRVSLKLTGVSISSSTVSIRKPDGSTLGSANVSTSGGFIDTQTLPVSGTYTILVDPASTNTGSMTLELYGVTDASGTITPGGGPVTVTTTIPGQNAQLTFAGTAGQRMSVNGSSAFGVCWSLGIFKPDGTELTNTFSCGNGIFIEPTALPVSGNYTVRFDPTGSAIGQGTASLYEVVDITGSISVGGSPVSITTTTPGQVARLSFTGTAGQRISLNGSSTFTTCWNLGIFKPDGTQLTNTFSCGSNIFIEPVGLPDSGSYTVVLDPSGAGTGGGTATLWEVADTSGSITIGGPAVNVTLGTPGQVGRLSFTGTAGQRVSLNGTSTFTTCWNLGIFKSDGTQLANTFSCGSNIFIEPVVLPESGSYMVVFDPSGAGTGGGTATLYESNDVTGTIVVDGPSGTVQLPTPGQNGRLTFDGTVGQRISVNTSSSLTSCWTVAILKPDGSQLAGTFTCGSAPFIEPQTLPVTGTYTLLIDPSGAGTGQATATLYNVVDVTGSITLGGAAVNVNLTVPGQKASYTMSGPSAQQATVRVVGSTFSCVTVTFLKPDGTTLTSTFTCGSTFNLATQTLPVTGTYTITVDPNGASTGSLSLSVTNP